MALKLEMPVEWRKVVISGILKVDPRGSPDRLDIGQDSKKVKVDS